MYLIRPLHAGRGPKNHVTRGPCSEINQRKSNRKSNKSMEIKVIFSKISYGKPYSEPKNPKNFPLASLATHEEEFSAQNARFFGPKTPRTRFVLQKPCKMRQNEPRIPKFSACGAPANRPLMPVLELKKIEREIKIFWKSNIDENGGLKIEISGQSSTRTRKFES